MSEYAAVRLLYTGPGGQLPAEISQVDGDDVPVRCRVQVGALGWPILPDRGDAQRLWNLAPRIPDANRYSRVYRGRPELIDHLFASHAITTLAWMRAWWTQASTSSSLSRRAKACADTPAPVAC
jgi:hypothetical protein